MSTNDPARPQSSRRGFLAATTATLVTAGAVVAPALASGPEPVDAIFREWKAVQDRIEAVPSGKLLDDFLDEQDEIAAALERQIEQAPPSIMRAAALALFTLRFGVMFLSTPPSAIAKGAEGIDNGAVLAAAVLPGFMPRLTGLVAAVAADFLAHPDRPVRESILFSGDVGEA